MKYFSHLNTAVQLVQQYKGETPFNIFLRSYFAQHKKYGSKDRKSISHLCYCYFRLGHALKDFQVEEKIMTGLFLCGQDANETLQQLKPEWNVQADKGLDEKITFLHNERIPFSITDIFPWKEALSNGIDHEHFCRSFLIQPHLFIRLRPGHEKNVKQKLQQANIQYEEASPTCLALPNASKIDSIIELDKEAVIQDLNSQQTGTFLSSPLQDTTSKIIQLWDCCAASGGKSILAHDLIPNMQLTVSDVRESIIYNLVKRFERAGITNYNAFISDLGKPQSINSNPQTNYDLIICDAPCSGSGTWSRTPEQLVFFKQERTDHYASLQRNIASNVIPHLKSGGTLVYITCSVFKKENEETVSYLEDKFALQVEKMETLKGYDKRADTLFTTLLRS